MDNQDVAASAEDDPFEGLKLIDTDTHYSEPYDLWTSRAPQSMKDRVPQVRVDANGGQSWFLGDEVLFHAGGLSFVDRQGSKMPYFNPDITDHGNLWDEIHEASYDAKARVRLMDQLGVHAHIVYSNVMGFSTGTLIRLEDKELAHACVAIYNDAISEWASQASDRLYPQAILPFWDIDLSIKEAVRCKEELGLTGVTMSGEPHTAGLPDLGDTAWDPFYEAIGDLRMPINIHVGSQPVAGGSAKFSRPAWPSLPPRAQKPVNSVEVELANSRFVSNLVVSDVLHRWPDVKWVSVESGVGWIPYVLERVDYEYFEDFPGLETPDTPSSFEMFRRNVYGTFWFEHAGPRLAIEYIGPDNLMWETDFPHPTCLHPEAVRRSADVLRGLGDDVLRKVMQDNAAQLYGIPV